MSLTGRAVAEFVGTALLVAIVIGSGIMAETLTSDEGVSLLLNQLATVLGLGVLIAVLMPISGAHINPAVSLAILLRREISGGEAAVYVIAQLLGGMGGVALAHVMFGRAVLEISGNDRLTTGTFVGEIIATAGLIAIILLLVLRGSASLLPLVVPAWIGAGYVFTSSTSFANPAVTLGRMFTDSFAGISPLSGLGFMAAQLVGIAAALALVIPVMTASKEKSDD
ncbi:MAG: aquaporin family protein [Actinomycetota bacterium]|nr:aquaporin family protein [Actinomycetota bacterium]